jgi:GNAT superfamily N-acetyltransferase
VEESRLRVVRVSPGLTWRALDGRDVVGSVTAALMPNDRWFVWFDSCRADSYAGLVDAVAGNVGADVYATVDQADADLLAQLGALGFEVGRREGIYLIPTDPQRTGLEPTPPGEGIVIISAADADEDDLRRLDEELRMDVPGSEGWSWDPAGFREETYDSPSFDPATYRVAVDAGSGRYVGLARVWMDPGRPRLGLIAVLPAYRRRGLARTLLGQVFSVVHERGHGLVNAEIDDTNLASMTLLTGVGASRNGATVELVRRLPSLPA